MNPLNRKIIGKRIKGIKIGNEYICIEYSEEKISCDADFEDNIIIELEDGTVIRIWCSEFGSLEVERENEY